ncbi:MAG: histidinol-phosphatase [Alphaproteobacteria bacterium]|nr:histidinol-phosphatase [Alphaproteobacteria bacterium]
MTLPDALSEALSFAGRLADAGRPVALEHFRSGAAADNKHAAGFDPVTAADRGVEAVIRELLAEHRPRDGVIGEEGAPSPSRSGLTWVIDPIDGTRAFIAGLPTWTTLIALQDETGPLISVIDQPFTGERFLGAANRGAWLEHRGDRRPLSVREGVSGISDAILSTTDPGLFEGREADAFSGIAVAAKVRRYGLDAYAYAALALGGVDLVVESGLKAWDAAALIPVVTGAGGVVTSWSGGPCHGGGQVVAAATPALHAEALTHLASASA